MKHKIFRIPVFENFEYFTAFVIEFRFCNVRIWFAIKSGFVCSFNKDLLT